MTTVFDPLPFLQAEYSALKLEQATRISVRDNALNAALLVIAAIATIAFSAPESRILYLLAIPPSVSALGAIFVAQDVMVSRIRVFVEKELPVLIVAAKGSEDATKALAELRSTIFTWESYHKREGRTRRYRKILVTLLLLLVFVVSSALALAATCLPAYRAGGWLLLSWFAEVILTLAIAGFLLATAEY